VQAREQVAKLFRNVPVLDAGGRAATVTFTQRDIGDALATFENEALHVKNEVGDSVEIIYPPSSIRADSPVALIDKVVDRKGIRKQATGYLQFLYTDAAQEAIARNYLRPRSEAIAKKYAASFKSLNFFSVEEIFGSWKSAQKRHFDDGGEFDQIYAIK
jgi:sulfate transport system substrate-binding protein